MRDLHTGGLTLVFYCSGQSPAEPDHSDQTVSADLTSIFTGGTPICTDSDCSEYEQDLTFLGWHPDEA